MRNIDLGTDSEGLGPITSDYAPTLRVPLVIDAAGGTLSGAGAIDPDDGYTQWTTTGADAGTLANGDHYGQICKVVQVVDGGTGTLTPASFADGTSLAFADVGDYVELMWGSSGWRVVFKCNVATGDAGPAIT